MVHIKVVLYPADSYGCGHFRMIWPAEALQAAGYDGIEVKPPGQRDVKIIVRGETVKDVLTDADVVVFQRLTHNWMAQAVGVLRNKGVAVVVDIDDDLGRIHPSNPAYDSMHPKHERSANESGNPRRISWHNLSAACRDATLVTVSTPALLGVYASHGRGRVLHNYLPDAYYGVPHVDSDVIGWPASLHSHPDDPSVVGGAIARLCGPENAFRVVGDPTGSGTAFGLPYAPQGGGTDVAGWPAAVATLGIGIAPLADTRFNAAKSWLKPLEMSALGVPWVASPRAEYARLHAKGAGLLADNPRRWYRALRQLQSSADARAELAGAGRRVADGLRRRDPAHLWWEAWSYARELQSRETAALI